ncbi:hypothetical protein CFP56_007754 [Quercus suber]|uniref:Aminotransferase-like plant mobile domain-containing protein n=1 Tax=Quercus suber TaxID=58331 RepID=A0AAW0M6V0_QUESU
MSKLELVRLALDSARESFQWRPYTKVNGEKEEWIPVGHNLDEEFESFARCLRPSELVGIDCIKQYLPHREGPLPHKDRLRYQPLDIYPAPLHRC